MVYVILCLTCDTVGNMYANQMSVQYQIRSMDGKNLFLLIWLTNYFSVFALVLPFSWSIIDIMLKE